MESTREKREKEMESGGGGAVKPTVSRNLGRHLGIQAAAFAPFKTKQCLKRKKLTLTLKLQMTLASLEGSI